MPECLNCGRPLDRVRRTRLQRVVYADMYLCTKCGYRVGHFRTPLQANLEYVFSRHTRCIRCATDHVHRQPHRDRIDRLSNHPLSWLWRLTLAPLNKCDTCRLQYFDWRPVHGPSSDA